MKTDYSLKNGTSLKGGEYKIAKVLGHGTFGITYLASTKIAAQGTLGSMDVEVKVAIKEFFMGDVNSRHADGSSVDGSSGSVFSNYRKKFRKEAENLSKLNHEGIVKVIDVFDENNTTYYVMEFLDGLNLDDYVALKRGLREDEAKAILRELGEALEYMHRGHMLHLDIKPKNVMRRADGKCILIDFGLSKQFTDDGEPESSTSIGLGTPGYSPVEQASYRQDGSFPATLDVYALGATFYKMLCGERPSDATIILNEGFPEEKLRQKRITEKTIRAVERAMSPIKKNRFQTIGQFLDALEIVEEKDWTVVEEDIVVQAVKRPDSEPDARPKPFRNPVDSVPEDTPLKFDPQHGVERKTEAINKNWIRFLTISGVAIVALIISWIAIYSPESSAIGDYDYANDSVYVEEVVAEEVMVDSVFEHTPLGEEVVVVD